MEKKTQELISELRTWFFYRIKTLSRKIEKLKDDLADVKSNLNMQMLYPRTHGMFPARSRVDKEDINNKLSNTQLILDVLIRELRMSFEERMMKAFEECGEEYSHAKLDRALCKFSDFVKEARNGE